MPGWLLLGPSLMGSAPIQLVPREATQVVFAGRAERIEAWFRNVTSTEAIVPLWLRVFQASADTAAPLADAHRWKTLSVLAGQTVVEAATVQFPAVRAETKFLVQWLDSRDHALGATEVITVPTNLLTELRVLGGGRPLGLFDPQDRLKPVLRTGGVDYELLDLEALAHVRAHLAVVCCEETEEVERSALIRKLKRCREAGVDVLWFRPTAPGSNECLPVRLEKPGIGTLVIADDRELSDLEANAAQQRMLISLARLAVRAEPFELNPP